MYPAQGRLFPVAHVPAPNPEPCPGHSIRPVLRAPAGLQSVVPLFHRSQRYPLNADVRSANSAICCAIWLVSIFCSRVQSKRRAILSRNKLRIVATENVYQTAASLTVTICSTMSCADSTPRNSFTSSLYVRFTTPRKAGPAWLKAIASITLPPSAGRTLSLR